MNAKAFLIDLDGVLYVGKSPVPGVRELLDRLDRLGYPYCFVSNSTRRCRSSVAQRLRGLGYSIPEDLIFTPSLAAVDRLRRAGQDRCYLLTTGDVHRDFEDAGIAVTDRDADAVVVGDAGQDFTFDRMNAALRLLLDGAGLLALERDRYWMEPDGLVLSAGPFVAALEYATGVKSTLVGKPAPEFFGMALAHLGVAPQDAAMIGDDILTDVGGAIGSGMKGILVKTGKYRADLVASSGIEPDQVLESLADLGRYL